MARYHTHTHTPRYHAHTPRYHAHTLASYTHTFSLSLSWTHTCQDEGGTEGYDSEARFNKLFVHLPMTFALGALFLEVLYIVYQQIRGLLFCPARASQVSVFVFVY